MEEIVKTEKEYLRNILGKKLYDSEERDDTQGGYRKMGRKYWSELYAIAKENHIKLEVHHINFDHNDNRLCNLVVLTRQEHNLMHKLFDPAYKEKLKKKSIAMLGKNKGKKLNDTVKNNMSKAHTGVPLSDNHRNAISNATRGVAKTEKQIEGLKRGWITRKAKGTAKAHWKLVNGKRVYY